MNRDVYKHVLATYGRRPGMWIGIVIEIIRTLLIRVVVILIVAQIASQIAAGQFAEAQVSALLFVAAYVSGVIIGAVGELLLIWNEDVEYGRLMVNYYKVLATKDMSFYRDHQTGYLTSLFRQYLDGMLSFVRQLRGEALRMIISLTVPAIVLCIVSLPVGLITLAVIGLQILYVAIVSHRVTKYRHESHEVYRMISGEVSDTLTNIVAFKGAGRINQAVTKMESLAAKEVRAFWLRRRAMAIYDIPRLLLTSVGMGMGLLIVAQSHDTTIVGLVVLITTYTFQIMRNLSEVPSLIAGHDESITKIHPTLALLDNAGQKVQDPKNPVKLSGRRGEISIHNVRFAYHEQVIFDDLSLTIKGGEHVGIVGLSGAGKSTLASLLMRFDDVADGSISIDGTDIRTVTQDDLHRHIAYVPQEPLLFHRSVKENVLYFRPRATQEELIKAAKAAHAHSFIEKLPSGYDTIVGERGIKLSGGQKQRVVIARAILKDAPILIFDEATSALDSESEQIIQNALPEIIGQHTAIVIAHRLSTVAGLDRIIVMHDGKIVEEGTHEQLLKQKGRYYSLWQKQTTRRGILTS